ncbi:MAG TPA: hypothetical protein PLZ36_00855 [Armatimonadota bacterium]|mgnify:CR=1 FL=1|nr:hypothetical protein [Armatimonadota bacterium]
MTSRLPFLLLCGLLGLSALPVTAASLVKTVTITDYLGVAWTDELVHETLTFAPGALKGVPRARVTVGKTPILSQLSDVTRHADGSVAAMNVWFMATVPAHGSVTYTITPGAAGPAPAGAGVTVTAETMELTSGGAAPVGIRLLNGAKSFDWPVPATTVPGPLQGLLLPSGRVTGGGSFAVPFNVRSYHAAVTAAGPLFAEATVRYQFDTGYWTFTARVVAGSPLVQITEELDTGWNAQQTAQVDRFYTVTLNGEHFNPTQAYYLGRPRQGYTDLLEGVAQPEVLATMHQPSVSGCNASGYMLKSDENRTEYYLIGWPCWSAGVGVGIRYVEPGKDAVGFIAANTPYWRNQMALRFRATKDGAVQACLPLQVYHQEWETDGYGRTSPNATGTTTDVPDTTARRCYGIMLTAAEDERQAVLGSLLRASAKVGAWPLDAVRRWTLDWPDPMAGAGWAAESSEAAQALMAQVRNWIANKRATGNFGTFSMHDYFLVAQWGVGSKGIKELGAVLNDVTQLSAADRRTLRRQAAYVAYVMHSPHVFPWGSGAHLGNPNMSIMAMNTRVFAGQTIEDHPMFTQWGAWTTAFMRAYIARFTRESGAAYECPSYTLGVTWKQIAEANTILMQAGVGDAFAGSRMPTSLRFSMNCWLLPPDLRFNGRRTIMPVGNTSYQSVTPDMAKLMVEYYRDRDPRLAGEFQWFANQTLPTDKQLALVDDIVPELGSAWYTDYGVVMRHGFGTPHETYFHMMAGNCLGHYETTDHMSYTLYAKGHPINLHFGNGYFPMYGRPWLRNSISVDHRVHWAYERLYAQVQAAAFMPATEYAHGALDMDELLPRCGEYPPDYGKPDPDPLKFAPREAMPTMTWHRQILFVKDQDPKGPNYFVVRDAFGGKPAKPTDDTFWFLANDMTRDGDVFHFDGQLPVDMDVFVNSPAGARPETGKFGHVQQPYARMTGDDLRYYPNKVRREDQLFLRLQQPAGGGYCVVLYPRLKGIDPPATYTSLGEHAVKVVTPLSTDYLLLNAFPASAKADDVDITGTAVAVRKYADGKIVVTNSEGAAAVTIAGTTITGAGPFSVTLAGGKVETKTYSADATVEVR